MCWIRYKVKQVGNDENTIQVDCWKNSLKVGESGDGVNKKNLLMTGNTREMVNQSQTAWGVFSM